jgi:subtilase family serine protease
MGRTLAFLLVVLILLAGCGGNVGPSPLPSTDQTARARNHKDDTATALPGGDTATALPGAQLPCNPILPAGTASCSVAINTNAGAISNSSLPAALVPGLHPADLQNAYALPSTQAGRLVAIVDAYDDPAAETDLSIYRSTFGLPACSSSNGCFKKVNERGVQGSYPAFDTGWAQEISIDLDMVSAACPRCSIVLVEADSASMQDLGASVDEAVALGARVVSNSYYAAEWSGETADDAYFHHPGIPVTVSSGDQIWPTYPAASPYVTAVGGTSLTGSADSWSESGWTYTGHGCSAYEPLPSFQSGFTSCTTRSTVDVSAAADPQNGVAMYDTAAGGWLVAGGTSVGAPLVAAAYALAANGVPTGYTYGHAADLHEIGAARYTSLTGLGSPNGVGAF